MSEHLFLRALRGEAVERPPVWAMRQAGRWDPEFRHLRGETEFYDFARDADKAAEASLLPARFGVDAVILFYDITTLAQAVGLEFDLLPGRGPVPRRPVATLADVERLASEPSGPALDAVHRTLALVRERLGGELPVLAFAGAPYTLATYCVGTGKAVDDTRVFASANTRVWDALLERLADATVLFLEGMVQRGADAWQLFDSWAGDLKVGEYDAWCAPYHERIFGEVQGAPSVLFVREHPFLERAVASGASAVHLGTSHDLAECVRRWPHLGFQGNVDLELLRSGTPEQVAAATRACVQAGRGGRHVVGLADGMRPECKPECFEAFVKTVREAGAEAVEGGA